MINALRRSAAHVIIDDVESPHLSDDDHHHLSRALRLRDGEAVTCTDGRGSWVLTAFVKGQLQVEGEVHREPTPTPQLSLAVVPLKGDRTDLVIEKAVEIGVDRLVIVSPTERSVVRWTNDKTTSVMDRYVRIVRSAVMQSRRVQVPEVVGPVALGSLTSVGVAFAEPGGGTPIGDVTTLVIGPEGGFSATELDGAPGVVDLGPGILRAETAAIVAAARLVAHWRR